ncbi:Acetyl-coenzyme A transporter [Babesia ovata]|uniref:Acetyl-coenzyme A transporter n=1 Tax=Babesia ovata TaxID=189622 RepID=A0A2H6KH94_9APIC|nr:Acetyl-coenzyme A transporter [Babesia ovata]GBE62365.1 Acetyl-coenzyme A transporter [Babesia ovata]
MDAQIMMLKPAKMLAIALLTCNFFFAVENPAELKMLEKGIPRDAFAAVTPLFVPIQILLPPFVSSGELNTIPLKVTMSMHKSSASDVLCKGLKIRLITVVLYTAYSTDGLYLETLLCAVSGVVFLPKFRSMLTRIESFELGEWYVNKFAVE